MSRVITFSRYFPSYHPRKGDQTFFVRSIWEGLDKLNYLHELNDPELEQETKDFYSKINYTPKWHTIRAGNRWKVGDWFSPRVWSGKPYRSKQIIIAPDIEIKKIWDFEKDSESEDYYLNGELLFIDDLLVIAKNDGLEMNDLFMWFNKPFTGQIISWNPKINY